MISRPTLLLYHSLSFVLPLPSPCPLNSHASRSLHKLTPLQLCDIFNAWAYSIKTFQLHSSHEGQKCWFFENVHHFPKSWGSHHMHTKPKISSCFIDASDTADVINKTCFGAQPNSIETYKFIMHLFAAQAASHFLNLPRLSDRNNRLVFWKQRLCHSIKGPWPFAHQHIISPLNTTHSADYHAHCKTYAHFAPF